MTENIREEFASHGKRAPRNSDIRELASIDEGSEISRLMVALYEVISFEEGGEPNWERMKSLFSGHVRITRITPEGTDYLDFDGFQAMVLELIDLGAFTCFYEYELDRRVQTFGNVKHIASLYETKTRPEATTHLSRGINSIQLVQESGAWKILSLLWDETGDGAWLSLDDPFGEAR